MEKSVEDTVTTTKKALTGADIAAERARHRLTQAEVAERMDFYVQTMPLIENDKLELSQEQYQRILAAIAALAQEG